MKPISWGVLGAARIALNKVIPGMQRTELGRVVALGSRDLAKAEEAVRALAAALPSTSSRIRVLGR